MRAIADIVDSTGGIMWCKADDGTFSVNAQWSMEGRPTWVLHSEHVFIRNLELTQAVVELREEGADDNSLSWVSSFPWLRELPRAWIAVPILHGNELFAFLVLAEARTNESITWEDRDLLRTVGRQAASYLAVLRATEALAEARQFEAFNRLSAFLVHDLKNIVAQLSLVVSNAKRHRDNPEFITDTFATIGDAAAKINQMLANLRQDPSDLIRCNEDVELNGLIDNAIARRGGGLPHPVFIRTDSPMVVQATYDRFLSVLEHLIQNAQDATSDRGEVWVELAREDDCVVVTVADTGCGMDEEFIRTRLFRPFDTTKGKAGIGLGVYESRHLVCAMGGQLEVTSVPGRGTTIKISLPCAEMYEQEPELSAIQRSQA